MPRWKMILLCLKVIYLCAIADFRYGRFTLEVSGPPVPGVVTAVVLMAPEGDEIDIEILGGDPHHWQVYNMQVLEPL